MPSGVGLAIVIAALLAALLVAGFVLTRSRRARPKRTRPKPAPPKARPEGRAEAPPRGPAPSAPVTAPPRPTPVPPAVREGLGGRIRAVFGRGEVGEDTWRALEDVLLKADIGPAGTRALVGRVREAYRPGLDPTDLLSTSITEVFAADPPFDLPPGRLSVVMVVGVNGSGKTTTIGKLAHLLSRRGRKVSVAASDTFRAAAAEQLDAWARRAGADLVAQQRGADPGAVAFDAVKAAQARGADVLIVDTAGRIHTRTPLMEELKKVRRVLERAGGTVDETLLVLDATTGQNGIAQARAFVEAVEVSGIVLTKLDGSAKGGIVVAVREELGIPVKLVGTGEAIDDLEPFDPRRFAGALVSGDGR
jgi:fused signal recognition particle receptor